MLAYFFKSSYISSWRKNILTLKIVGRCRMRLNIYTLLHFFSIFFSIFVFASIKSILKSLESISVWYQMNAYSITFQLNTKYIHFVAIKFCQTWKTYPSPFLKWKKKNSLKSLDKIVELRYRQNPVKICKIENIPFFKYFDHKYHFIKDY
jgi:hypothetical protein